MSEAILPGVYIEVRPEGLIVPGQISVGNLGVVGTASKGEVGKSTLVSDYGDARQKFGAYDSFIDPVTGKRRVNELTLVRALEQAFAYGATTVFAVRVAAAASVKEAAFVLMNGADKVVTLTAKSAGTWGNDLKVNVAAAEESAFIEDETVDPITPKLSSKPIASARNRFTHTSALTGIQTVFVGANIVTGAAPGPGQVQINPATVDLVFHGTLGLAVGDTIKASYVVDKANAVKVTVRLGTANETYTVVNGSDLIADIKEQSNWVVGSAPVGHVPSKLPALSASVDAFASLQGGNNGEGATQSDYEAGLNVLLNEDTHIMVGAGQDDTFGSELDKHCQKASTDVIKRDRIAVVGSKLQDPTKPEVFFDYLRGHNLSSDRLIFVAPGIQASDAAAVAPNPSDVVLPGAYAAAAFAGLLASFSPHISPTNKVLPVDGLERIFTSPELTQLVQRGILLLEKRQGFRVVRGITTQPPGSAFAQITTRRIVDYAKYGVRSAATPYIGLLNNERVRGALKATVNSFLSEMVLDEMLVSYELTVTASRQDEVKGIARVTMTLRPTFSIDFIKVTMFLE
jgi:hypothetical protein